MQEVGAYTGICTGGRSPTTISLLHNYKPSIHLGICNDPRDLRGQNDAAPFIEAYHTCNQVTSHQTTTADYHDKHTLGSCEPRAQGNLGRPRHATPFRAVWQQWTKGRIRMKEVANSGCTTIPRGAWGSRPICRHGMPRTTGESKLREWYPKMQMGTLFGGTQLGNCPGM